MDFSFIEPAFKTAFGNVSTTKTATDYIFKSTVAEDSYFSLDLSLALDKLEIVFETKDKVFRRRMFFSKTLALIPGNNENLCSIIVKIVQNLSSVSEWGFSDKIEKLPINRLNFVVGEFKRLEAIHGKKNYFIIEGADKKILHYPEGCGLVLQMTQVGEGTTTLVTSGEYFHQFNGSTIILFRTIGWWFHNHGEPLKDWIDAPVEVFGVFGLEYPPNPTKEPVQDFERVENLTRALLTIAGVDRKGVLLEIFCATSKGEKTVEIKGLIDPDIIKILAVTGHSLKTESATDDSGQLVILSRISW